MITLDKWYPMVQPRHDVKTVAFDKAVERVQEDYRNVIKAKKVEKATETLDLELYNKRARVNQLELEMFTDRRRFQIFI
jgi:vacuolar-type H+-ATPase subunit D/Vma8